MSGGGIDPGQPDLQIRRQAQLRRRRHRMVAGVAAAVLVLVLVWVVGWSPAFVVREVLVHGTSLTSQQQVEDAAAVPLGQPLGQLDTSAVARRVESLPTVASARVSRSWPSSAVIDVTERSIVYQRVDGQQYQWIDSQGVIFQVSAQRQQVPVANLPSTDDRQLLADVATVVAALPTDVRTRVQSLQASSRNNILVVLDRNQSIFWGGSQQSDLKASLLPVLLAQQGNVFDVSAPSDPAIK